jgi:anti-sigma factor RsiW
MKCEKLRQEFMEAVLDGPETVSPEMREHLQSCAACAEELVALQQTMTLLEEWPTPEPSPYFSTRLRARMREEEAAPARTWLAWFRRPVVAAAAALLIALGAGLLEIGHFRGDSNTLATNDNMIRVNATESAVGDLQYLDKNADLFSDFDALDGQSSTTE